MTVFSVSVAYTNNDKMEYQILPYSLWGTIKVYLKFKNGLLSLVKFLKTCRLTEKSARKLKKRLEDKNYDWMV